MLSLLLKGTLTKKKNVREQQNLIIGKKRENMKFSIDQANINSTP